MSKQEEFSHFILILTLYCYHTDLSTNSYPIIAFCVCLILISIQKILLITLKESEKNKGSFKKNYSIIKLLFIFTIGILIVIDKDLFVFLPAFYFLLELSSKASYFYFFLIPFAALLAGASLEQFLFILGQSYLTSLLNTVIMNNKQFKNKSYHEIDRLRIINENRKHEQETLIKAQDDLIANSILKERSRIINEIHDILGHQLSSAIIQIAALEYVITDQNIKNSLLNLKDTLNSSMNNIRSVIHVEKANSINLKFEIQTLVDQFTKCNIHFTYKNTANFSNQAIHSIVNIIKEALTNINKHSNASYVTLSVQETDKYVILLIVDNGNQIEDFSTCQKGIGLMIMEERVQRLKGNLHIITDNGFRIFIKIPKELNDETNDC
ncbi:sensor histidine kinase [Facklamia miroungae]|uniref:histidine kinase n=1 Tax=Facklamia miroungae TaxID=120956 RepID=A0A1G7QSN7_9LACT|nr:histidine kinase [Facklamia miroungae]NKZ29050.1 hypothetical protein [Facklamia miroungae]SDG01527.1 Signal transduction histidine kinase [Facklamia miroungae]